MLHLDLRSDLEEVEDSLKEIIRECSSFLRIYEEKREEVMKLNREIISYSARCTEASKRGEREKAMKYLEEAKKRVRRCHKIISEVKQGEKLYSLISEGEKELVEAILTYSYVFNEPYGEILTHLNPFSIILGIMDFSGELRRIFIEMITNDDFEEAEKTVNLLKEIYLNIIYEDLRLSVVPGFKRRLDILRNQIEKCMENLNFSRRLANRSISREDEC